MEHEMLLVDADFKVVARMKARRKHADVADHSARLVSGNTRANTSPSAPDCESE